MNEHIRSQADEWERVQQEVEQRAHRRAMREIVPLGCFAFACLSAVAAVWSFYAVWCLMTK